MKQSQLAAMVSDSVERFSDNIMSRETDLLSHFNDIIRSLELLDYIKVKSVRIEEDESKMGYYKDIETGKPVRRSDRVEIYDSRLSEVQYTVEVTYKGESVTLERAFAIPKIVDKTFFLLRGNTYFPIYQLVDKDIIVSNKFYSLKTMLMPIKFKHRQNTMKDILTGSEHPYTELILDLFKKKLPYMVYYIAKYGLEEACSMWGYTYNKDVVFLASPNGKTKLEDFKQAYEIDFNNPNIMLFSISKLGWLAASKKKFKTKSDFNFLNSLLLSLKLTKGKLPDLESYQAAFGGIFTKSLVYEKCLNVLFSFERILDNSTRKNFISISDEDKLNTYHLVRYMVKNFENFRFQDQSNLSLRRLQCWEYLLQPLLLNLSESSYRIINNKNLTLKTICSIFNFSYWFLIKRTLKNDFVRYNGCVNNIDIFGTLKATFKGAAALGSNDVANKARGINPSFVGNLSLVTTSAGDPGSSTTICPFAKIGPDGSFL